MLSYLSIDLNGAQWGENFLFNNFANSKLSPNSIYYYFFHFETLCNQAWILLLLCSLFSHFLPSNFKIWTWHWKNWVEKSECKRKIWHWSSKFRVSSTLPYQKKELKKVTLKKVMIKWNRSNLVDLFGNFYFYQHNFEWKPIFFYKKWKIVQ